MGVKAAFSGSEKFARMGLITRATVGQEVAFWGMGWQGTRV